MRIKQESDSQKPTPPPSTPSPWYKATAAAGTRKLHKPGLDVTPGIRHRLLINQAAPALRSSRPRPHGPCQLCGWHCIRHDSCAICEQLWSSRRRWHPLQYSCLENPMDRGAWRLQSMGSLRVRHDYTPSLSLFTFMQWRRQWQPTPVFFLENPRDGGAWWVAVYGVAQSRTRLKRFSSSSSNPSVHCSTITIARIWKQARCPLTNEWMKRLWYIYTMEYYSAIKEHI